MWTGIRPAGRIVEITEWAEDYQQILCDCILQEVHKATYCSLLVVVVCRGNVADYKDEIWDELTEHWVAEDWLRADEYAAAMLRGDVFPPIIVDMPGGLLRDGYHRIAACVKAGIETIDVVYVYENAKRFEDCLTVQDSKGVWSRGSVRPSKQKAENG
jgi:hypothetical protein